MNNQLIDIWLNKGIINEEQAVLMKEDIDALRTESSYGKFIAAISIIGSIFLGIGVIWIVASNWDSMRDLFKILILLVATGSTLYAGYETGFRKASLPKTGNALVFLSAILFGASTFLIAQIYNVQAHASYLLLIWLIGIIPTVYLFQSALLTVLSCIVFCAWFNFFILDDMQNFGPRQIALIAFFYQTFGISLFAFGSLHYFSTSLNKVLEPSG